MSDKAPIVYDKYGNPMRVRMVGARCAGDMSGEGHYYYSPETVEVLQPTVWFEATKREEIEEND